MQFVITIFTHLRMRLAGRTSDPDGQI